jgi:hypothetical protein
MFNNRNMGIDASALGTDGFSMTGGTADGTNTFHNMNTLLNSWNYQIVVPHDITAPP